MLNNKKDNNMIYYKIINKKQIDRQQPMTAAELMAFDATVIKREVWR